MSDIRFQISDVNKRVIVPLCLIGLVVAGVGGCGRPPVTEHLITGKPFPDITLTHLNGATRHFDAYRGKLVIFNVWATWCGPCRRELPSLQHLHQALDPKRFAVVAMSVDTDEVQVREYLLDQGLTLPAYIDKGGAIADGVFGVRVYPDTFVIGPDGRLLAQYAGGRDWDTPRVVAALKAARAGKPFSI